MMFKKRGYFFFIDAFIGGAILAITLIIILSSNVKEQSTGQSFAIAEDFMSFVINTQIRDIDNNYTSTLINDGNITNLKVTINNQISEFYYRNTTGCTFCMEMAYNFTREFIEGSIPSNYGVSYSVNNTIIYQRDADKLNTSKLVLASKKLSFFMINDTKMFGPVVTEVRVWLK